MRPDKKTKLLRPTSGKVREALFDILRGRIENSRFLDLYAGTGAVGVEALKQGAKEVHFVEAGRGNASEIGKSLDKLHLPEKGKVIIRKALAFIGWAEINGMTFDIIFLDPPYHTEEIMHVLEALGKADILNDDGIMVVEHFTKRRLPDSFGRLNRIRDYTYGDTALSLYGREADKPQRPGGAEEDKE
ncbi:MAG: 16S rRNA (guanine(966)-N(2))-methyltransferase RsmD [Nitrospiraceae bacterium]|nr:MAG: 16S rRNA (guanine(966)-N(2))-methyltransferase RsmD [Nitrospiraceae bacterium]